MTEIGSQASENCSSLDMVVSGNGLETIGSDAFAGCDSLTGVEVPDSVTEIGDSAFGDNANLTLGAVKTVRHGSMQKQMASWQRNVSAGQFCGSGSTGG